MKNLCKPNDSHSLPHHTKKLLPDVESSTFSSIRNFLLYLLYVKLERGDPP